MAGRAMGIATTGSVMGTLIGMFFLATLTPVLGNLALKFGAYEFFWLALFGVIIAGTLTGDDPLKGWIAGIAGLFIATIGQEIRVSAVGTVKLPRSHRPITASPVR
jgi:putative tricarboxylic transport membrane protein